MNVLLPSSLCMCHFFNTPYIKKHRIFGIIYWTPSTIIDAPQHNSIMLTKATQITIQKQLESVYSGTLSSLIFDLFWGFRIRKCLLGAFKQLHLYSGRTRKCCLCVTWHIRDIYFKHPVVFHYFFCKHSNLIN